MTSNLWLRIFKQKIIFYILRFAHLSIRLDILCTSYHPVNEVRVFQVEELDDEYETEIVATATTSEF